MKIKPSTYREDIEKRANVLIETDPQGDAKSAEQKTDPEAPHGVRIIGGGSHGKTDKGVKRISRRSAE